MRRLDRLVGKHLNAGKKRVREVFENGLVEVDGVVVRERATLVGAFAKVVVAGEVVQARTRRVLILHKPAGVVSATVDPEHPTVIDLVDRPWAGELHLAGRLDRFTTGLVVLTNDSEFSEALTEPGKKVGKCYRVTVDGEILPEVVRNFEAGIWMEKEQVRTAPAQVKLVSERECWLTIFEGKHHQIKRMFARWDLKVTRLHRVRIGSIELGDLKVGEWRELEV